MTIMRKRIVLLYFILFLIGAALFAYGALSRCAGSTAELSEAQKLAELEAALIEAAATGKAKQVESDDPGQTPANRPSRTRST